jgi:DNA-binding NtrC family response regulator
MRGGPVARILVVDDEAEVRQVLHTILAERGYEVVEARGLAEARKALASGEIHVVFTDQNMQDGAGLDVLATCRELDAGIPVVFLTGYATVELAVDAMRTGAFDFLPKPFSRDQVLSVARRAVDRSELFRENERLRGQVRHLSVQGEIVGDSPPLVNLRELITRVAPTDATVLIVGETGTGKELVARALHAASSRCGRAFLPINCAGFTESLLESELFGHERGAFTGADRARQGVFEAAHHGTLLLDEAGEMSLGLQARLLRVLVTGELVRVGSSVPRKVDVRILAATHRDLEQRVREGLFREDLFYRLAVVPLRVPPLRERAEDIPMLVEHILRLAAREMKVTAKPVAAAAMTMLSSYDFPGNVRELRNILERALILARGGSIQPDDLPFSPGGRVAALAGGGEGLLHLVSTLPPRLDLRQVLTVVERSLVTRALASSGGVAAEAARRLGVSRSDLAYKLKRLSLDGPKKAMNT